MTAIPKVGVPYLVAKFNETVILIFLVSYSLATAAKKMKGCCLIKLQLNSKLLYKATHYRFTLNKNQRLIISVLSLSLIFIWIITLVPAITPPSNPIQTPLYTYSLASDSSYSVNLLTNDVYPTSSLEENAAYPARLMQSLSVKFDANYQASHPSSAITCTYSVKARVSGFQTLGGMQTDIYSKEYQLTGPKTVSQNNVSSLNVIQSLDIDPAEYFNYSENAQNQISSSLNHQVQILFEGIFETATEHGVVAEPFTSTLTMPLGNEIFTINKSDPYTGQNAFILNQPQSVFAKPFFYVWLFLLLAAIVLLLTLFFSRLPSPPEAFNAQLKKILRQYSNRLIEIIDIPTESKQVEIHLTRFANLLRISEEVQKPLFYKRNSDGLPEDGCFYVLDTHYRYCYQEDKKPYTL